MIFFCCKNHIMTAAVPCYVHIIFYKKVVKYKMKFSLKKFSPFVFLLSIPFCSFHSKRSFSSWFFFLARKLRCEILQSWQECIFVKLINKSCAWFSHNLFKKLQRWFFFNLFRKCILNLWHVIYNKLILKITNEKNDWYLQIKTSTYVTKLIDLCTIVCIMHFLRS